MIRSKHSAFSPALILGGAGLVGLAISHKLLQEGYGHVIIVCLGTDDEQRDIQLLRKAYPRARISFEPVNIFSLTVRGKQTDLRHYQERLTPEIVRESALYRLLTKYQPEILIDAVNTSSILAYQSTDYSGDRVLQLVRFFQLLYLSFSLLALDKRPQKYIKMGTTGTGGLGLNIPYTHGEDQPSLDLLTKSALAGAYTQLLFLLSRTPGMPAVREIKPACAIAWKRINYGPVKKAGTALHLDHEYEVCRFDRHAIEPTLPHLQSDTVLEAPYLDSGENGYFSLEEFRALTSVGQMEYVTPDELADLVWQELQGVTTGRDIISSFDSSVVPPSYIAGVRRQQALTQLEELSHHHHRPSVAFELLGPPRLSKLLWEAYLLLSLVSPSDLQQSPSVISQQLEHLLIADRNLCLQITSIGLPILLKDGQRYLRGSQIKAPFSRLQERESAIQSGWVDLRIENIRLWQKRIMAYTADGLPLTPGDLAALIFSGEDGGYRDKQ